MKIKFKIKETRERVKSSGGAHTWGCVLFRVGYIIISRSWVPLPAL